MDSDSEDKNVVSKALEKEKVVERILSFLPPCEIKRMRLVSKFWSKGGAKILVEKCFLRPTSCLPRQKTGIYYEKKLPAIKKFSNFLQLASSPVYLKVVCGRNDCSKLMEVMKKVPELNNSTRELKFSGDGSSPIKDLAQLVTKLPFVDFLHTSTLNLNLSQFDVENKKKKNKDNNNNSDNSNSSEDDSNDEEEEYSKDDFGNFLERLKDLDELHLEHFLRTDVELGDYLTHEKSLKALKSLSLITCNGLIDNIPRERTFLSSSYKYWKITHLTWKLDRKMSKGLIHNFVLKFASTLKYLNMTLDLFQESATPWTDDWYIPYDLQQLKVLEINGYSEHVQSGIFIGLQINSLEKLIVKNVKNPIYISFWEDHRLANGRKLCSLTIKEVEIDKVEYQNSELLSGKLWPNVKSVKIGKVFLSNSSPNYTNPTFINMKYLEHLQFDLSAVPTKDFYLYELWMVGDFCKSIYTSGEVVERTSDDFRIRDLESLKSLKITGAGYIGDFFVYNCFQDLRNLQNLYLQGARISQTAFEDLQNQLGPTTSITFSENSAAQNITDLAPVLYFRTKKLIFTSEEEFLKMESYKIGILNNQITFVEVDPVSSPFAPKIYCLPGGNLVNPETVVYNCGYSEQHSDILSTAKASACGCPSCIKFLLESEDNRLVPGLATKICEVDHTMSLPLAKAVVREAWAILFGHLLLSFKVRRHGDEEMSERQFDYSEDFEKMMKMLIIKVTNMISPQVTSLMVNLSHGQTIDQNEILVYSLKMLPPSVIKTYREQVEKQVEKKQHVDTIKQQTMDFLDQKKQQHLELLASLSPEEIEDLQKRPESSKRSVTPLSIEEQKLATLKNILKADERRYEEIQEEKRKKLKEQEILSEPDTFLQFLYSKGCLRENSSAPETKKRWQLYLAGMLRTDTVFINAKGIMKTRRRVELENLARKEIYNLV